MKAPPKREDARQTGKEIDADKVLKAARRVTGVADSDSESDSSDREMIKKSEPKPSTQKSKQSVSTIKHKSDQTKAGPTTVEIGEEDLEHFNAEKDKLIKDEGTSMSVKRSGTDKNQSEEAQLIKSLFVTQEDDAFEKFEQEKDE